MGVSISTAFLSLGGKSAEVAWKPQPHMLRLDHAAVRAQAKHTTEP